MMRNFLLRILFAATLLTLGSTLQAKTYLVSVGIGDYSGYPMKVNNLSLTVNDARTMANLYASNTTVDYALLLDEKATKQRIVKAIDKVFSKAGKDDIVVFYFSGHGYPGGLCAYNGNITYKTIRDAMAKSKCENKMMFIDACRAGGMRVDNKKTNREVNSAKKSKVMLFLSARNNEDSIERSDMTNGLFTSFLAKGMKGYADANKDRTITAKELFEYVHTEVAKDSRQSQHPVMWGNFNNSMPVIKW